MIITENWELSNVNLTNAKRREIVYVQMYYKSQIDWMLETY
jgi:hypothetical protein